MGFLEDQGALALGSRLRRLVERMYAQGAEVYPAHGFDFDPRLFPIFGKLAFQGPASVGEVAADLGLSHPTVVQGAASLERRGLVSSRRGEDARRRVLELTPEGEVLSERLKPFWNVLRAQMEAAEREEGVPLLPAVEAFERAMDRRSFADRLDRRTAVEVTIGPMRPEDAVAFRRLTLAWIEALYRVEPSDREQLEDPYASIIRPGGSILIARHGDDLVGGVALVPRAPGEVELGKMGVADEWSGQGIGQRLMEASLLRAEEMGAEWVRLDSNRAGSAIAIRMYRRFGFVEIPPAPTKYERSDIQMARRVAEPRAFVLRRLTVADAEELAPIAIASFVDGWCDFIGEDRATAYAERHLNPGALAKLVEDPSARAWVALSRVGHRILGFSHLEVKEDHAHFHRLYLSRAARGTGAGTTLLRVAEAQARWEGLGEMRLTCHPRNPRAWRFYEREGYASVAPFIYDLGPGEPRPEVHLLAKRVADPNP